VENKRCRDIRRKNFISLLYASTVSIAQRIQNSAHLKIIQLIGEEIPEKGHLRIIQNKKTNSWDTNCKLFFIPNCLPERAGLLWWI